jgi:phthalate 4,5-dioxygenase
MLTAQQNERITRSGADTPGGALLRHYWQPVALADELSDEATQGRPVKGVQVLGQHLVLFKDAQGKYALLDRDCPHRGADLAYGRLEPAGLRCPFHGWQFDAQGRCVETPGEPTGSRLCDRVRQRAYPVVEKAGIVWAWLGPLPQETSPEDAHGTGISTHHPVKTPMEWALSSLPAFPHFDCFAAPDTHVFAFKGLWECNWLQALEVGIDPAHASFLHRFFDDEDTKDAYGKQFRNASSDSVVPMTKLLREHGNPDISVEPAAHGLRLTALRRMSDAHTHVRVTAQIFPQAFLIPLSDEMTITQWHVPIDDARCYWYAVFTSYGAPVDKATMRAQRLQLYNLPDYVPRVGRHNQYGFNAAEQRAHTYTGLGFDINVHDQWAVESQGAFSAGAMRGTQDRTREHLGTTDKAIMAYRRQLMKAIDTVEAGGKPPMVLSSAEAQAMTGPVTVDGIGPTGDKEATIAYWKGVDARRRARAPWAVPAAA